MTDASPAPAVPETKPSMMEAAKYSAWQYIGAMFTDPKGGDGEHAVSMKRVMAMGAFGLCMWSWYAGKDAPAQAFYFLCAVVLAQGGIAMVEKWKGTTPPSE